MKTKTKTKIVSLQVHDRKGETFVFKDWQADTLPRTGDSLLFSHENKLIRATVTEITFHLGNTQDCWMGEEIIYIHAEVLYLMGMYDNPIL